VRDGRLAPLSVTLPAAPVPHQPPHTCYLTPALASPALRSLALMPMTLFDAQCDVVWRLMRPDKLGHLAAQSAFSLSPPLPPLILTPLLTTPPPTLVGTYSLHTHWQHIGTPSHSHLFSTPKPLPPHAACPLSMAHSATFSSSSSSSCTKSPGFFFFSTIIL